MRHTAVLFLLLERLCIPEFEYVFTPRKASFPCTFFQPRVQSHGYTETRCARSSVRMCVRINTPNTAGRHEGSLGQHSSWLQHPYGGLHWASQARQAEVCDVTRLSNRRQGTWAFSTPSLGHLNTNGWPHTNRTLCRQLLLRKGTHHGLLSRPIS